MSKKRKKRRLHFGAQGRAAGTDGGRFEHEGGVCGKYVGVMMVRAGSKKQGPDPVHSVLLK
jgi:hypothetical protein